MLSQIPVPSEPFHTIRSGNLELTICEYGAAIQSLIVHLQNGSSVDIICGFDTAEDYARNRSCLGAVPGRFANRIAGASFTLNGLEYHTDPNENGNTLHGGSDGYHKRRFTWIPTESEDTAYPSIRLQLNSPDGDQGMPGNLTLIVTYTLSDRDELLIDYTAVSDQDTYLNVTNHSYFNLSGHSHGCIDADHRFAIYADSYLTVNEAKIPQTQAPTAGTVFDLRSLAPLPADPSDPSTCCRYDHCFCLNGPTGTLRPAASACSDTTGLRMDVETDLPGVQFYTANFLNTEGKEGTHYSPKGSFCFETQYYPDNMHHPEFEQSILKAGTSFSSRTLFRFTECR